MLCLAPGHDAKPCTRSAEWPTETDMRDELIRLALEQNA